MRFSICTPVVYMKDTPDNEYQPRYEMFLRCARSVFSQTYTDFEWVIFDDQCQPKVEEILETMDEWYKPKGLQVKIIRLDRKEGRIFGRNEAMKAATGDWITWLDADDEYSSLYLEAASKAIDIYPDYSVFNMNHLIFSYDYSVYTKNFIDVEKLEGRPFGSGTIGAGSYFFKKSIFNEIGEIPVKGLWQFAYDAMDEFPEIKPFFWIEERKGYNSLGNPWGEDYYYFYKMTRKYPSKYLNTALYFVHSHYGHRWKDEPNYESGEPKGAIWNKAIQ